MPIHPKTIFTKTAKGVEEIRNKTLRMPQDAGLVFLAVDGKRTFVDLSQNASMDESGLTRVLDKLVADGYIKVFSQPDDFDLDFTSSEAIARINNQARAQARTEAEAKARADKAAREAAEAKARQDAEARVYAAAQAKAKVEAEAKDRAEAVAAEAGRVRARAEADVKAATEAQALAEAETRMRAAAEAKAKADAEAEQRAAAEANARLEVEAARQAAANARVEADARARAEAEARSLAEEESRAREAVEAKLRAMESRLRQAEERAKAEAEERVAAERRAREEAETTIRKAHEEAQASVRKAREEAEASIESERKARTEAEAQTETERQLREEALKEAQQELEARLEEEQRSRAEAIRKAREEAEARAHAQIEVRIQVERKAREEAEARLQMERQAREDAEREAEAKAAEVAAARAVADRLMRESERDANQLREKADRIAGTAHAAYDKAAIDKARDEMMERVRAEQKAIEERVRGAQQKAIEKVQDHAIKEKLAEEEAKARIEAEKKARELAEMEAKARVEAEMRARELEDEKVDAKARAEYQKRAEARAVQILAEKKAAMEAAARARAPVPWGRMAAVGVAALIAVVLGLLHVIPFPVAGTEKLLSDRLQEPVRIGSLNFAVYPSPHWRLERIVIGNNEDIKIGEARAPARLPGLSGARHLDELQLSAVTIDQDAVPRMAAWVKPQAGDQSLRIDSLRVSAIKLAIRDLKLPIFDATITLAADGALKNIVLHEPRMNVELTPVKRGEWTGKFKGNGWRLPIADGVEFGELGGEISLLQGRIAISRIEGTLYGGSIKGEATVKWNSQLDAEARFDLSGVELGQLLPARGSGFSASGSLEGKMRLTSQGARAIELLAAPTAVATFSVRKGVLNNVDLLRALQATGRGGKTPFDEITGELQVTGNHFLYRDINLLSKALKASGSIDVSPISQLSGRISVQVGTKTVTVTRGTLNVTGSVKSPTLSP